MYVYYMISLTKVKKKYGQIFKYWGKTTNYKIKHGCSYFLSVAVKYTFTKSNLGREQFTGYRVSVRECRPGTWSRNPGGLLLTHINPVSAQPALFYKAGPPARGGTSYSGLYSCQSINNKKIVHWGVHRAVWWRQFLSWGLSFQACQVYNQV